MKNPAVKNDDEDTETGLPRKLGWTVAFWALTLLQMIIIALLGFLITATIDQGRRIARIEGRMGISAQSEAKPHYAFRWSSPITGSNHFTLFDHGGEL